jgi:hypothetical protein
MVQVSCRFSFLVTLNVPFSDWDVQFKNAFGYSLFFQEKKETDALNLCMSDKGGILHFWDFHSPFRLLNTNDAYDIVLVPSAATYFVYAKGPVVSGGTLPSS